MRRVVCLGDSLTEGYVVNKNQSWVSLLNEEMDSQFINCGISGDTTTGMIARLQRIFIDENPDLLIILGGTNDLFFNINNGNIISNIIAMSRHAKHYNVEVVIGIPTPFFPTSLSKEWFLSEDGYMNRIKEFQKVLKQITIAEKIPCIDFSTNMTEDLFLEDGLHPNAKGHQKMKENAMNVLKNVLNKQ